MRIDKNTTIRLGDRNIVKIKIGDSVIWQKTTEPVVGPDYFYIESLGDGNTISVKNKGDGSTDNVTPTLEYSVDKSTWNTITFDWTSGTHTTELPVTLNTGEKMYFRNDTRKFSNSSNKYISFSSSVSSNVGGDIRTLSNYLDVNSETTPQSYMFYLLFYNNKNIVDASNLRLPYTTLADYCYNSMFRGCTSLTTAPELPATTMVDSCYSSMFRDCSKLTTAPTLPSTKLRRFCYSQMFYGCTSLTTAPELPATTLADYCYSIMFSDCTSLTTAPELPATKLESNCYNGMFKGCTSLNTAPELPATTLAINCYYEMFQGCSKLTVAHTLPATTLAPYCYYSMFENCTSLTTAPALPATTLADYCYNRMFLNCTSLTTAPELPATKLESNCYNSMFFSCNNLTSAPELPATTLASNCYFRMFYGCTSLTTAPELPATTLAYSCYRLMFENCKSLNNVTVYADDISATDCTNSWLSGVASTGTFNNYGSATYTTDSPSGIPTGWTEVKPVEGPDYFYIESLGDANTISVKNKGNGTLYSVTPTLEYSTDKNTWNTITFDWTSGTHTTELPVKLNTGEKMYFRNDTRKFSSDYDKYITFSSTVSSNVGGDIRTLSNYLDVDNETTVQEYMFRDLFSSNKNIVDASNLRLPYTTLAKACYVAMFNGCSSLTTAPALPATTLATQCYGSMFRYCTSLTTAPELPVTTLANNCYNNMFENCTALTTAPALPATTIIESCYDGMFSGCTSLTSAPELPATTLANNCYKLMFWGCTSLNSVTVYADDNSAYNCIDRWLGRVASSGTFRNLGSATYPTNSTSGIPTGWTEVKN